MASPVATVAITVQDEASGSAGAAAPPADDCSRSLQRRFPKARRCLTRLSLGLPTSGAARGLAVIVALLLVGLVGSFALHQMMSPEIEALSQQRERLKDDVSALRLQLENMTRVADSRLETIHLLETELERQHVQAAEAAATATTATKPDKPGLEPAKNELRPSVVLPNFFYTVLLGSIVLASVLYRILLIVRSEMLEQQKLGKKPTARGLMSMPSVAEGGRTPPMSPTRPADERKGATGAALSPTAKGEASPQCYKRAPGSSPTIV